MPEIASSRVGMIPQAANEQLRGLRLLERSRLVRKLVDLAIRGVEVEPAPPHLSAGERAILVTNYPSVTEGLRALLKFGSRLPGDTFRVRAIGRSEVVERANLLFRVLGLDQLIFPARKNHSGRYSLEPGTLKRILAYLEGEGNLLALTITGDTRGNGMLERDVRTGAAFFSVKKRLPLVPVGLVTAERGGKVRVVKVRFGEAIQPPDVGELGELAMSDFLLDYSLLAMCHIAALLPPGQRGDFEDVEERLSEITRRLENSYPNRLAIPER
jgi:1-acyl-sn-glycerol-3-phosphate acyltransferase